MNILTCVRRSLSTPKHIIRFMSNCSRTPLSKTIELPDRPFVLDNGTIIHRPLQLHYWEWPGTKPTVLFCHAASFHSRCYDAIIDQAFPESHVISVDLRGHGRSQKHPAPYHFHWFGDDITELVRKLVLETIIGIGHSVGGYSLVRAACDLAEKNKKSKFHLLTLLEPVILPREMYVNKDSEQHKMVSTSFEPLRRRKMKWTSAENMIEHMAKREPFSRWSSSVLRTYCLYAIDDDYRLLCSPDTEVSIYANCILGSAQIYDKIQQSDNLNGVSVRIIRCSKPCISKLPIDASFTSPALATYFAQGQDIMLDNTTHLFPMEKPHLISSLLKNLL